MFDQNRYFDVFVEYAKESPEDILIQITVHNRGPEAAEIHLLPTLWFRNRWSWGRENPRPMLQALPGQPGVLRVNEEDLGERHLYCDGKAALLFTENETNAKKLFGGENRTPYVKDAFNNFVVHGQTKAVNPEADRHEGRRALSRDRARRKMRGRPVALERCRARCFGAGLRAGQWRVRQSFRRSVAGAAERGG